ncbi:YjiH family protein [Aquibacillus sp. LR5S19]|uniref:YjiH family protein n=2 Tax=Aquibacillus rhizosphaerae TaxID=3051431 RepID=A0ABT7L1P9_9BACI|nr:YjiH family protein [Aquibacillus sp. LR5S19]MDL4839772.1 YjiH family protein [Aquibacillus sp. LR5S19]
MVPITYNDEITIPVALMAGVLESLLYDKLPLTVTIILLLVAIVSIWATSVKSRRFTTNSFLNNLFVIHPAWVFVRVIGFILAFMTLYKIGPEWIWSENTGGLLLFDLIPLLFTIFLFAGIFLPLLLNFGLLELLGTLLDKIMKPLFTLPGRSSIDCLASWMGDGTIGVLLTNTQYEEGFYTKREAAVISTTFSVVSITFSIVILTYMKLQSYFMSYYFAIVISSFVAALILPRIPPLSRKPDTYVIENKQMEQTDYLSGKERLSFGMIKALERAKANNSFGFTMKSGLKNVVDMWFGVLPVVMAFGTIAVIIAETTTVFEIIGAPFIPILHLLQVPEATEAAQTMVLGFADMFLPAVIGRGIESELTRFVIASVSVTQLIYMSEVGGILLASKLPVHFLDLIVIFLLRTLITLPIIAGIAHIVF